MSRASSNTINVGYGINQPWTEELSNVADFTINDGDEGKLFYVNSSVTTNLVVDFGTFATGKVVYFYCDSALTTADDQTVHLNVQTSVGNYTKLFKGDGVYRVTKSALTGTYLFARA